MLVAKGQVSMWDVFAHVVESKGQDDEAIWSRTECLTFHQLHARVNQYAQWFLSQNVKPGDLVAIYMANSPDFMGVWFALLAIGAAPALINTNLASQALVHCVELAQTKLILADGDAMLHSNLDSVQAHLEASGHKIVRLLDVRQHILGLASVRPADELRRGLSPDAPMMLGYTSGTTGLPKAISFPIGVFAAFAISVWTLPSREWLV